MQQTLLIVDDEPNILRALERVFQDDGYRVLTATSGAEGLKLLAKLSVQVIISDQRMPNMTGSEFLTEVKRLYPNTVRIILSGYSEFEAVKTAINEGAIYKFFNKPWDETMLHQEVRDAFAINLQQNEKERQLIRLMNFAKLSGLNGNKLSDVDILEPEMHEALEKKQFIIYYQPIVFADTEYIRGAEALLYWQHPTKGFLSPEKFIPLFEETGMIIPVTGWVMKTACQQLKKWQSEGNANLCLAINLSAYQLNHSGLLDLVVEILQSTQIPANCLDLEITESLIMYNVESNIILLQKLKNLGVQLSLDDFGTGYSSLSYLKSFPIDILKIDKSFTQDVSTNPISAEIVTTIILLAKSLGLAVIAEGVETKNQLEFMRKQHCDFIQGYYFSKPITAEEMTDLLLAEKNK